MAVRGQDITSVIKRQIEEFGKEVSMVDVGTVIESGDGVARVQGLSGVRYTELVEFPNEIMGIALASMTQYMHSQIRLETGII